MRTVAAFDFDGTLTTKDSFLPFLSFVNGGIGMAGGAVLLPKLLGYGLGMVSRQGMKESTLSHFFKGWSEDRMNAWGKRFAKERLPSLLRPKARERIEWHKNQGHDCVLVSASIETYLKPWGLSIGLDAVIASRLLYRQGRFTGRLLGENCWGPEKVERLRDYLNCEVCKLYAYGDTRGDQELLAIADHSFYRRLS